MNKMVQNYYKQQKIKKIEIKQKHILSILKPNFNKMLTRDLRLLIIKYIGLSIDTKILNDNYKCILFTLLMKYFKKHNKYEKYVANFYLNYILF